MVIGRVTIRVTPFRPLTTLLISYLLSSLPLQVWFQGLPVVSIVVPFFGSTKYIIRIL